MLRLPPFRYHRPDTVEAAVGLLAELGPDARPVAGGTDLVPNMKHGVQEPKHLVALKSVVGLDAIRVVEDGTLVLGACATLSGIAGHPAVRERVPALADAAAHVAGPQLRNAGTIGGNLCLDTRCTYYNQTRFWRQALGFCLKKDGDVCHVTRVGRKCVAAHSADTPPVLMTVGARAVLAGPEGRREVDVEDFFLPDGIRNVRLEPGEIVVEVRVPPRPEGQRTAYRKLRQRRAIDFPLLTVAVAGELEADGTVRDLRGVVTGLGSRPRTLTGWSDIASGERLDDTVVEALAERAHAQCHPLENMAIDPDWRRAMVPVQVRRVLRELRA